MKHGAIFLILLVLAFSNNAPISAQEDIRLICAVELERVPFDKDGHPIRLSRRLDERCFSTPAEAMAFITEGAVSLPLPSTQDEVNAAYEKYLASDTMPRSYIIAQMFDGTGYQNMLFQFYNQFPCAYMSGYAESLAGTPYNDRAESGSAYAGCNKMTVMEHGDGGGVYLDCYPGCSTFGILNNEVSAWLVIHQ